MPDFVMLLPTSIFHCFSVLIRLQIFLKPNLVFLKISSHIIPSCINASPFCITSHLASHFSFWKLTLFNLQLKIPVIFCILLYNIFYHFASHFSFWSLTFLIHFAVPQDPCDILYYFTSCIASNFPYWLCSSSRSPAASSRQCSAWRTRTSATATPTPRQSLGRATPSKPSPRPWLAR